MGVRISTIPDNAPEWVTQLDGDIHLALASHSVFKYIALFSLILSTDYVLALRTAAIYSFQRNVSSVVGILVFLQTALTIWATTKWIVLELPTGIPGCFVRPAVHLEIGVSLYWLPSSITDAVVFVLTVSKVFPIWSSSKQNRLSWVILRDEILYYGVVALLRIATNVLMHTKNEFLGSIMAPLTLTLSPVIVFHTVLNVRSVIYNPQSTSQEAPISMREILAATHEPRARSSAIDLTPDIERARPILVRRGLKGREASERDVIEGRAVSNPQVERPRMA
ncbi:hypothetical protein JCM3765_001347 [Sporobolomyces pararoseus]